MSDETIDDLKADLKQHKELLARANKELEMMRDRVGKCSTTVMETVLLEKSQNEEITFLRARVSELEKIVTASQQQSKATEQVFTLMRAAMNRMQASIKKVTQQARETAAAAGLAKELEELEKAAEKASMPEDLKRLIGPD